MKLLDKERRWRKHFAINPLVEFDRLIEDRLETAFRAGMLAAADIVTDSARGFRLDREGVANKIREAAE